MSRSSAINASRNAQQSSQRAAQQATNQVVTATKNKGQQSVSRQKHNLVLDAVSKTL